MNTKVSRYLPGCRHGFVVTPSRTPPLKTFSRIPLGSITGGLKQVDVAVLYDAEEYRPKFCRVLGKPMFLY